MHTENYHQFLPQGISSREEGQITRWHEKTNPYKQKEVKTETAGGRAPAKK